MARRQETPQERATLLQMALIWSRLAERAAAFASDEVGRPSVGGVFCLEVGLSIIQRQRLVPSRMIPARSRSPPALL